MRKNIAQPDSPQMAIYGACAMNAGYLRVRLQQAQSVCNSYCFSTTTMVSRTSLDVTLEVYCLARSSPPLPRNRMSISSWRVLPPGYAILYYVVDAEWFRQPWPATHSESSLYLIQKCVSSSRARPSHRTHTTRQL